MESEPKTQGDALGRAMPWTGICRTVGAVETERDLLFHDTVAPHLAA
jgi:hypothetical protein